MGDHNNPSRLPGISAEEYTKLLLSVGGTSKARRPYSPVEIGEILLRSKLEGASTKDLTVSMGMTDTSMPGKFMKLVNLDTAVSHLVTWGASDRRALGFSVAAILSRIELSGQSLFAEKCLIHGITKDEAVSVIQLYQRSGQSMEECFDRVVARRPTTRTLQVILGSVNSDSHITGKLKSMSQLERDDLFLNVVCQVYPEVTNFSAKLGINRFTIIGGKSVARLISSDSNFSQKLNEKLVTFIHEETQ